jgi:hypothetical protein
LWMVLIRLTVRRNGNEWRRNVPTYHILFKNTTYFSATTEANNEERAREKVEQMDSSDLEVEYSDPMEIEEIEEITH